MRDLASRIEVADWLVSRSGMLVLVPSDWWKAVFGSKKNEEWGTELDGREPSKERRKECPGSGLVKMG